jgi:hypothetical protein
MNKSEVVPFALELLQKLDGMPMKSLPVSELIGSNDQISTLALLEQFAEAGIIEFRSGNQAQLRRPLEDLTPLDVLNAVWGKASRIPDFDWIYSAGQPSYRIKTREAVEKAFVSGIYPSEGGN